MNIHNKHSEEDKKYFFQTQYLLEFHKILDWVTDCAVSAEAKSFIQNLIHSDLNLNPENELELLEQIKEFLVHKKLSLNAFDDISPVVHLLNIDHSTLAPNQFESLLRLCRNVVSVKSISFKDIPGDFSKMMELVNEFPDLKSPILAILAVFDDYMNIMDSASPELKQIREEYRQIEKSILKTFKKELEIVRSKGYLAEGEESIRNGRFVLRVLAEHKRKVPGIIIDESESGKSIFIEPQVCLEQNNELVALELDEKREIAKILLQLSNKLRKFSKDFITAYHQLVELDIRIAKSIFALQINAVKPEISKLKKIFIEKAFHPILLLKFKEELRQPVPLSFFLNADNHLLLISGPNAGGKTIVLKTFGLLQLMLQKGFLIPVAKSSVFPVFKDIWVDIGDGQSLDEGLSTYSAKLRYMKTLVESVSSHSLVLIDELGSGTEPIIGGAIAESILSELIHKKAYGIITTHYANLKAFAHKTKGIINGSMLYDEKKMEPKYILQVGKPGGSYALDIAEKLKFPKHLIHYAKQKAGKHMVNLEGLIAKLEEEKLILESQNKEYIAKINSLNKLIKAYDNIQKQYEIKRLKLKLDSKQLEFEKNNYLKQESNSLINEIKDKLDIIKAKQLQEDILKKSKDMAAELNSISNQYTELLRQDMPSDPIKVGDKVHLIKLGLTGTVSEIGTKSAKIITEHFTINTDISEIHLLPESLVSSNKHKIQYDLIDAASTISAVIDLRGQLPHTAIKSLEHYLDKALISNIREVKIVHGKGTGVLRNTIHQVLRKNKFVEHFSHPEEQDGGNGITLIKFKQ